MPNTDEPMNPDEPTIDLSKEAPKTTLVLEQILEGINAGFAEMRLEFRKINKRLDVMSGDVQQVRSDIRLLEDRVDDLERKAS